MLSFAAIAASILLFVLTSICEKIGPAFVASQSGTNCCGPFVSVLLANSRFRTASFPLLNQNAFWFKSGNDAVLNRLFANKTLTKGPQQFVPDWLATNAGPIFSQMLVRTNNKIDAAIAANDNIAGAVVADLKAKHLQPIPLSGQDATPQGIQYILAGRQSGTVYKYVPDEANAAAAAAVALVKGTTPKTNGFRLNGKAKEPTLALPVVWITKSNYTRLFTDKFLKKNQVCIGT